MEFFKKHLKDLLMLTLIIFSLVLIVIATNRYTSDHTKINVSDVVEYNSGWYYYENEQKVMVTDITRAATNTKNVPLVLYNTLPDSISDEDILYFETKNELVRVSIVEDNAIIYEFGYAAEWPYVHEIGAIRNFAPLAHEYAGKTVKVEITPTGAPNSVASYSFLVDDEHSIYVELLSDNLVIILAVMLLLIITMTYFFIAIMYFISKNPNAMKNLMFGVFTLLSTIWTASDNLLLQLVFENKLISYLLFNTSFLLMPVAYALFASYAFPTYKRHFNLASYFLMGYFVLRMVLYLTGVCNFETGLWIIHALMGCVIVLTLYSTLMLRKKEQVSYKIWSIAIFTCIESIALIVFNVTSKLTKYRFQYSTYFFLGIFLFVIIYAIGTIVESRRIAEQAAKAKYFELRAYQDELTNLGNRSAFEEHLDELENDYPNLNTIGMVMLDLNNLKKTNDDFGHQVGDELIKEVCKCLLAAFSDIGKVYRIGGDEMMAVIVNHPDNQIREAIKNFEEMSQHKATSQYKMDYALGYAFNDYRVSPEITVRKVSRAADINMYENKSLRKSGRGE